MRAKLILKNHDLEWEEWRAMMKRFSLSTQNLCRRAGVALCQRGWSEGCGISSSDINHRMFGIWKEADKSETSYLGRCVQIVFEEEVDL